jgi:predicted phosphodiesterase
VLVQLLSDLHFEFHQDGGRELVASLDPTRVDVLVLAGDIAVGEGISSALALFAERYCHSAIVYVHGNHEFYGTDRKSVLELTSRACAAHPNVVWLDGATADVAGRRFLGAPLWFRRDPKADRHKRAMTDFSEIRDFESWVYEENARALEWLDAELREGDIVITHHLPARRSIAPRFSNHPLNPFFLCDVEALVRERKPRLWLHGHTHVSVRYDIGPTTVLANPFGYARWEVNADFDERLLVEP